MTTALWPSSSLLPTHRKLRDGWGTRAFVRSTSQTLRKMRLRQRSQLGTKQTCDEGHGEGE